MMRAAFLALPLAALTNPALAQHHAGHPPEPAPAATSNAGSEDIAPQEGAPAEAPVAKMDGAMGQMPMDHGAMKAGASVDAARTADPMDRAPMGPDKMKQRSAQSPPSAPMDHSSMGQMAMDEMPIPQGPPPPQAFSGPVHAADAFAGAEVMEESRAELAKEFSGGTYSWFQGDRVEYRARQGGDVYLWDLQGYYGGDINKLWLRFEGEGTFGQSVERAEVQALWSRAVTPFFDFQAGVRQDLAGPDRTHLVLGAQGLAPYEFQVVAAAFLSNKGDLTSRLSLDLDQRITQRLILQPRAEVNLSAQDIPELGIGAGIDTFEAGVRLRYEFARELAPYIGVEQSWRLGNSADFARVAGGDPSKTNYVVGIRFWF